MKIKTKLRSRAQFIKETLQETEVLIDRLHYPDACSLCSSPAYIGAGFTPPDCSNNSCEYYEGK